MSPAVKKCQAFANFREAAPGVLNHPLHNEMMNALDKSELSSGGKPTGLPPGLAQSRPGLPFTPTTLNCKPT